MRPPSVRSSVALASRNGEAHIREQLSSILTQTVLVDEIVVSDDASTDRTLEIVDEFARYAAADVPIIRVLKNTDALGVTANFEQALLAAAGHIIFLSDQDDLWHSERVAAALAAFDRDPRALLINSDATLIDANGRNTGSTLFASLGVSRVERDSLANGRAFDALLRRNLVTGATVAIRAELVERARPFPEHWLHDEWLAVVAALDDGVRCLPEPLVKYRQHETNLIGVKKLSPAIAVARLTESRSIRNSRLLARARELDTYVRSTDTEVTIPRREATRGKVLYEEARSALPPGRFRRVDPVLRLARSGDYARYGRGPADILRDLFQPA